MAISPLFIPLFTIEEIILDKDSGLPLTGGVVTFYRDSQRLVPKPVYQITGTSPTYAFVSVGNQLTLGLAGDFVDSNGDPFVPYAYPYDSNGAVDLYFVRVESAGGVEQFTREAVPYIGQDGISPAERASTNNELCNPHFVEVSFPAEGSFVINVTGSNTVTPIAPGWDFVSSGTGTITVQRIEPTSSSVLTNPPYTLSITASSGLGAAITLRQRMNNSPGIGRGKFASGSILAAVISGGASAINMIYAPSTGTPTTIIGSTNIPTDGAYHIIADNELIPQQVTSAASVGYVDINISIPTSRTVAISSIQVVFIPTSLDVPFDEETADRQKDNLFHYYEESLVMQSKENILTGWNFSLNPWQFITTTGTTVPAQTQYIADQTILHQETASALTSGRAGGGINFGLQLTARNGFAANRFALIQYIDSATMKPYFGQILSAMAQSLLNTTHATVTRLKMRLIYRTAGDTIPTISNSEPITGWDGNGDVTFAAGWTAIAPLNDVAYQVENVSVSNSHNPPSFSYNQFQLPAAVSTNTFLGVVVYITAPLNTTSGTEDVIAFDRISLVNNDFALDCALETYDESLRKCQYYYEKSYPIATVPGTASAFGLMTFPAQVQRVGTSQSRVYENTFNLRFKQTKRSTPVTTFYDPSGTLNRIQMQCYFASTPLAGSPVSLPSGQWSQGSSSVDSLIMQPAVTGIVFSSATSLDGYEAIMDFHYTADSRLGL